MALVFLRTLISLHDFPYLYAQLTDDTQGYFVNTYILTNQRVTQTDAVKELTLISIASMFYG